MRKLALIPIFLACSSDKSVCPEGMVSAHGTAGPFCISAYEVELVGDAGRRDQGVDFPDGSTTGKPRSHPGAVPSRVSWYQAYAACKGKGWHLCSSEEWQDACDGVAGAGGASFPTPNGKYKPEQCAVGDFVEGVKAELAKTGERSKCHTSTGIHDMLGNLWEWTDPGGKDEKGRPLIDKRGGAHYGAEPVSCQFSSVASHGPAFVGTIGFRCCVSPD